MTEITNKHLLIAILTTGIITIGLLVPLQNKVPGSYRGNDLGATAYNADYSGSPTNSFFDLRPQQPYQAIINRTYDNPIIETTTQTTYYTTTTEQSYSDNYYYQDIQGYIPPGCESGTDYSITTGEPCG